MNGIYDERYKRVQNRISDLKDRVDRIDKRLWGIMVAITMTFISSFLSLVLKYII